MPNGKPAGVPCVQLTPERRCAIHGRPERPACCSGLAPSLEMCGADRESALAWLMALEHATAPGGLDRTVPSAGLARSVGAVESPIR